MIMYLSLVLFPVLRYNSGDAVNLLKVASVASVATENATLRMLCQGRMLCSGMLCHGECNTSVGLGNATGS